jgi:DNA polymerase-3 subunit epsilon
MSWDPRALFASPPWDQVVYWSLDLETGGLDVRRDPIIAVGMVPLRAGVVRLGEAYRTLVRPIGEARVTPDSVRAHQLVGGELRDAPPLHEVLPEVDRRIREGALLVHMASIDVAFLRREYERARLGWPKPPVVDTVALLVKAAEKSRFLRPDAVADLPALNLAEARRANGLPDYPAHDPLLDAIATAELFLVLRKRLGAKKLRDLR